MFQYAAARSVAIRLGCGLNLDLSWFGADSDRHFALSPFNINAQIIPSEYSTSHNNGLIFRYGRRVLRFLKLNQDDISTFVEHSFKYDSAIERVFAPVLLNGYFQSEKYFDSIRESIVREFALRDAPSLGNAKILEKISKSDAICLHIRRGDYVSNSAANAYHGTCSLEYYKAGLNLMVEGLTNPHCFVFSDDMEWVRENFRADIPLTLVDINSVTAAHEDLRLMVACKRFVIANS